MKELQNTINLDGLYDDIFSVMMLNAQQKIINKIMQSASNGLRSCEITSKGVTPVFLDQLENEGVSFIKDENDLYTLFWEF